MSRRKPKTTAESFDTLAALRANAEKLRAILDSIEIHGDGEHPSTIADVAKISTALTAVCSELRQHAKAEARAIESLPVELIVARLKALPDEQRERIGRELAGLDEQESLLS